MNCKYCDKLCKNNNSLRNHERLCKINPNAQSMISGFVRYNEKRATLGIKGSNQYTKAKDLGLSKPQLSNDARAKIAIASKGRKYSEEYKQKLSIAMIKAVQEHPESYTKNNVVGRVKNIEYNGIKLKGSWEVIVAKWLDSLGLLWEHETRAFEYDWNGKRLYFPDFYIPSLDKYIEVKGYETDRDRCKWKVVPNLIVIKKQQINEIKNNMYKGLV